MVPPSSDRISRVPPYLICRICSFAYGTITHYGWLSHAILLLQVWSAPPRSLAATWGISIDVFSSGYWDVSLLPVCLYAYAQIPNLGWVGFPIQKSPGHRILPPHRRLSQAITSFIASDCQGIHHVHFITWPYNPKGSYVWVMCNDITYVYAWFSSLYFFDNYLRYKWFGIICGSYQVNHLVGTWWLTQTHN